MNDIFVLSRLILNNLPTNSIGDYLKSKGLYNEFLKARKNKVDYSDFIADLVTNYVISIQELDEFLFDSLFYGIHKNNYISYIEHIGVIDESKLFERLDLYYKKNSEFINIVGNTLRETNNRLVALKLVKKNNVLQTVKLLYGIIVKLKTQNGIEDAYSYIPIEIDYLQKRVCIRVAPKAGLAEDYYKPTYIKQRFTEEIMQLFGITYIEINNDIFNTIYKISRTLIDDVYEKMHGNTLFDDESDILKITNQIEHILYKNGLTITKNMSQEYGIFDIFKNVKSLMNNAIVLKKIIKTFNISEIQLDGYLLYLKYQDKDEYNITLKSDTDETISFSETFLRIKSDLDEFRYVSAIKVIWNLVHDKKLELKYRFYDTVSLNIRFYADTTEGDFFYALEKFEEFRQKDIKIISRVDRTYVTDEDEESQPDVI